MRASVISRSWTPTPSRCTPYGVRTTIAGKRALARRPVDVGEDGHAVAQPDGLVMVDEDAFGLGGESLNRQRDRNDEQPGAHSSSRGKQPVTTLTPPCYAGRMVLLNRRAARPREAMPCSIPDIDVRAHDVSMLAVGCSRPPAESTARRRPPRRRRSARTDPPRAALRVIVDTDANNELDDQHALAYVLFNGGPSTSKASPSTRPGAAATSASRSRKRGA